MKEIPKGGSQRPMVMVSVPFWTTWANSPSVINTNIPSAGMAIIGCRSVRLRSISSTAPMRMHQTTGATISQSAAATGFMV